MTAKVATRQKEPEIYVVDTLIRRRRFVEATNKRQAERLAGAMVNGLVNSIEAPYLVEGTEVLAGVYLLAMLDESSDPA